MREIHVPPLHCLLPCYYFSDSHLALAALLPLRACAGLKRAETALEAVALAPSRGVPLVKDRYEGESSTYGFFCLYARSGAMHTCPLVRIVVRRDTRAHINSNNLTSKFSCLLMPFSSCICYFLLVLMDFVILCFKLILLRLFTLVFRADCFNRCVRFASIAAARIPNWFAARTRSPTRFANNAPRLSAPIIAQRRRVTLRRLRLRHQHRHHHHYLHRH